MSSLNRLVRHGRLAALIAALYPTTRDVVTEALANVCTDQMTLFSAPSWLTIALSLIVGVACGRVPDLVERCSRSLVAKWRARPRKPGCGQAGTAATLARSKG